MTTTLVSSDWLRQYSVNLAGSSPSTRNALLGICHGFLEYAEGRPIDKRLVYAYLEHLRRKKRYGDGSINLIYRTLARFLKVAGLKVNGEDILSRRDAPLIRETHVNAPALHPDVIRDMILAHRQLGPQHQAFLAMGTVFGLRRSEIVNLTTDSFDTRSNLVFVESLKGSRQRYHSVPPEIRDIVKAYDWALPITPYTANKVLWEIGQAIGMKLEGTAANWHAIRRTLDTLLLDSPGLSEAAVRDFLRWKAAGMTGRYYSARRFVGRDGSTTVMGTGEKDQDDRIFAVHPFLPYWRGLEGEKASHGSTKGKRAHPHRETALISAGA